MFHLASNTTVKLASGGHFETRGYTICLVILFLKMVSLLSIKTYHAQESSVYVHITIGFEYITTTDLNIKKTYASGYVFRCPIIGHV